ncbi:MAG: hypothetical protein Tsb0032_30500 [Kiloniellaceae bacterium]
MALPSYVGRYEVRDEIATGGFAVVVRAWDEELESPVALKILREEFARSEEMKLRFLEEARLLRRIRSPNIVTVHDLGRLNDGRPYFVMDFANRGTLAPRLQNRAKEDLGDPQAVMQLIDALANGLSAIHEAGVVHRDIKPANILFQQVRRGTYDATAGPGGEAAAQAALVEEDERILVGDLGIAKDLVKNDASATLIGGTPHYQAPEQDEEGAEITPAADIYASTALLWHVLTGEKPPQAHHVAGCLDLVPPVWHDVMLRGMALDPRDRFADVESWRSAIHDTLARQAESERGDSSTRPTSRPAACPYKGLAAYQPEDAANFFGREALVDELVHRVRLQQVLVVGGPSGSGKSSLVRAGLIPALNAGALPGSEGWRIALFTPGRDPLAELHFQISRLMQPRRPAVSIEDLEAHPTLARHLGAAEDGEAEMVICIDQFEELFTLVPAAQRARFVAALSAMTDPADSRVRVIITVRSDFYSACAQIPWLAERITRNQVLVGPMAASELRRAITEPARRGGIYLEPQLVDTIIDEAGEEAGSLPLIAHALVETWMRRKGRTLTLEGFRAAGGVAGAISQTADVTFEQQFDVGERQATKRLFLSLVTPGEGTPDTRRVLSLSEIDHDTSPDVMHRAIERLTDARLLTVDDSSVQIAHEALLHTWPRLRDWIEESRDDLRTRQRISRAAMDWDLAGRDSDLLYRGTPLLSALEWVGNNPDQLGAIERAFLAAAVEARDRAEAIAAESRRKTRRTRRFAVAALAVLAVSASAASVFALLAFREARQNEIRAEQATMEAHDRFAGALGAAAYGLANTDPLLALALSAEAIARAERNAPAYESRASLLAARRALAQPGPYLFGSPIPAGDALAIALSSDGALLATAQRNGRIDLIDTATRQRVGSSLQGHKGGIRDLDFAPDGRHLASAGADGSVRLWSLDATGAGAGVKLGQTDDVVSGVGFSPTGTIVASANGDGTVILWDVGQRASVKAPMTMNILGAKVVEFSADGRGLLAGYSDGTIYGWSLPSRKPLFEPFRDPRLNNPSKIAFSPSGDRFATASAEGTAILHEYPSGKIIGRAFATGDAVSTLVFTSDGKRLIGGSKDGAVKLWDVYRQELIMETPSGHAQAIMDAELSADGKLLATLGRDQLTRLWRFDHPFPLARELPVAGRAAKGVAISRDGRLLAAGDDRGTLQVWDLASEESPRRLFGHDQQVWSLGFSPDGSVLASGDRAGKVRLWDLEKGTIRWTIAAHDGPVWSLDFTPDGQRIMTASDSELRLWDSANGELAQSLPAGQGRLTRAVFSPDDALLATATTDGWIRVWDPAEAAVVHEIAADDNVIWGLAFSPDGRLLAAASSDEVVSLWEVATGREIAVFTGLSGGATDVAFLGDGVTLAAVDRRGGLHLWDTESGRRLIETWQAHRAASWRIAVHPDGTRFATSGDDGRVQLWDSFSTARACEIAGAAFDSVLRRQYLGKEERSLACDPAQ